MGRHLLFVRSSMLLGAAAIAVAGVVHIASAAPFKGDVSSFSATLQPTTLPLTAYDDNHIVIEPFAVNLKWTGGTKISGDTATAHFTVKWNPDSAQYVQDFPQPPAQTVKVDAKGSYDGWVPVVLAPTDAQKTFAHWCTKVGDTKRIPGQVFVSVDGLTGPGTQGATPIWFTLHVRCVSAKP